MNSWKELWLYTLDLSILQSQELIKSLEQLKCRNNPIIKQAIKLERANIRADMAHKKEVYRRYKAWQRKQTTGRNG